MRILAIAIFSFFSIFSFLIYLTKNYQYEKYVLLNKDSSKKLYMINLNLATWHDFASLPGIGDELAKTIIQDREDHGLFD